MTRDRYTELRRRVDRGELGCGPLTEALVREMLDEHEQWILAEYGATLIATEALGVTADAVRATAWSRVRAEFPTLAREERPV